MIVVDASAIVVVVVDQPAKLAVLDHLAQHPLVAPSHQPAEVLSALARLVRAGTVSVSTARVALADAAALAQEHVVPDAQQLRRALDLQDRIRVLDGLYVALAEARRCALLTTDARLAAANPPCDVLLVDDVSEATPR